MLICTLKVQEKFRLDLSEEDAIKHFEALLNETSYLSVVFDQIHNIAVRLSFSFMRHTNCIILSNIGDLEDTLMPHSTCHFPKFEML